MHSYTNNCNDKTQQHSNEVIFRNVRSRYKFENKISVLYVLSPKTKTSTHDYVGIYPRGWNHLRQFVGFEHPIPAPFEVPSLDRCIQFICQRPHITATPYCDYQFVYVNQYHEVLGKSDFFQFVEDDDGPLSDCAAAGYSEPNVCNEINAEWENDNVNPFDNLHQYVSEAEYAYNTCYFGDNPQNSAQGALHQPNVSFRGLDGASDACLVPQNGPNTCSILEEVCHQNSDQESYYKPRRGRPLVKTRDGGYLDHQAVSPEPFASIQRSYSNYMSSQGVKTAQDVPYSQKWFPPKTWRYQSNDALNMVAPYSGRSYVNRGAIPKQCPKCHVPSDHFYKQQLMQHELDQAREQIRDLNIRVDQLQQELQLSYAAQAKLKVVGEIAKTEAKNAVSFINSLMVSLVNQYKTKIVNFDNSVMYVTRELESPGWLAREGPPKTLLCGRPSIVRMVSGREKELKAIIGRQEMKIQKLHHDLKLAFKIIDCANLANSGINLKVNNRERGKDIHSTLYSPCVDGVTPKKMCDYNNAKSSSFDLTDVSKVMESISDSKTHQTSEVKTENSPQISKDLSGGKTFVVEPNYYQLDPMQFWNDGNSVCTVTGTDDASAPNETNNNNYDTKDLNSDEKVSKSMCTVCESTLGNSHENAPMEGSN